MKTLKDYINESKIQESVDDVFKNLLNLIKSEISTDELLKQLDNGGLDRFVKDKLLLDPKDYIWEVDNHGPNIVIIELVDPKKSNLYVSRKPIQIEYSKSTNELSIMLFDKDRNELYKLWDPIIYKKVLKNIKDLGFKRGRIGSTPWNRDAGAFITYSMNI